MQAKAVEKAKEPVATSRPTKSSDKPTETSVTRSARNERDKKNLDAKRALEKMFRKAAKGENDDNDEASADVSESGPSANGAWESEPSGDGGWGPEPSGGGWNEGGNTGGESGW